MKTKHIVIGALVIVGGVMLYRWNKNRKAKAPITIPDATNVKK
jgi:hypothetical protein